MVTVVKTITEHTNGRRLKEDGSGWERRIGTRPAVPQPGEKVGRRRAPRMETIWEDCEAPVTVVYGSEEHQARREAGKGGGTVAYVWGGLDDIQAQGELTRDEMEILLRSYVCEFTSCVRHMTGTVFGGDDITPQEAAQRSLAIGRRVETLFGLDLWETNLAAG